MKYIATLPLILFAFSAQAEEKKNDTLFIPQYLGCKETRADTKGKKESEQTCEQQVALQYCSIFDKLPKDVKESLSLEVYCNFIAGEQNGDATHDAKILSTATAVGCFEGNSRRDELARKYSHNKDVSDALDNFTRMLMVNEAACEQKAKDAPADAKPEEKKEEKKEKKKEAVKEEKKKEEAKPEVPLGKTELPTRKKEAKPEPKKEEAKDVVVEPQPEEKPAEAKPEEKKPEEKAEPAKPQPLSEEDIQALEDAGVKDEKKDAK